MLLMMTDDDGNVRKKWKEDGRTFDDVDADCWCGGYDTLASLTKTEHQKLFCCWCTLLVFSWHFIPFFK